MTNDVPGCPKGGLLSGTDKKDRLGGKYGDDEIHGLGGVDHILGGRGNDVLYGGDGNDALNGAWDNHNPDKLYCGPGKDVYDARNLDYADSSCEKKMKLVVRIDRTSRSFGPTVSWPALCPVLTGRDRRRAGPYRQVLGAACAFTRESRT
jgi:Ca2+-binding RTX toxin-like protein